MSKLNTWLQSHTSFGILGGSFLSAIEIQHKNELAQPKYERTQRRLRITGLVGGRCFMLYVSLITSIAGLTSCVSASDPVLQSEESFLVKTYRLLPAPDGIQLIQNAAEVFEMDIDGSVVEGKAGYYAHGRCGTTECSIFLHLPGEILEFYRSYDSDAGPKPVQPAIDHLEATSESLMAALFPNWPKRRELMSTTSRRFDDGTSRVQFSQFLSVTDSAVSPLLGGHTVLHFAGDKLDAAWIPIFSLEESESVLTSSEVSIGPVLDHFQLKVRDDVDSYVAYLGPTPSDRPDQLVPGLVVNSTPVRPNNDIPQPPHDLSAPITATGHVNRSFFLPMCGNGECPDNCRGDGDLCFPQSFEIGDPPILPVQSNEIRIFGEEVDEDVCRTPATESEMRFAGANWSGTASTKGNFGLQLRDVKLNSHKFADRVRSVHRYSTITSVGRFNNCQLTPDGNPTRDCRSFLVDGGLKVETVNTGGPRGTALSVNALYCVENFSAAIDELKSPECRPKLLIGQNYIFKPVRPGATGYMDISDSAPWNPSIEYAWINPPQNCPPVTLTGADFTAIIDNDIAPDRKDIAAFHTDTDTTVIQQGFVESLTGDQQTTLARFGQPGDEDNFHQKDPKKVSAIATTQFAILTSETPIVPAGPGGATTPLPSIPIQEHTRRYAESVRAQITIPGCSGVQNGEFGCAHYHWRWGQAIGQQFPTTFVPVGGQAGQVLTPSYQQVTAAVTTLPDSIASNPFAGVGTGTFDTLNGTDVWLLLRVSSRRDHGKIHLQEHFFFR